MKLIDKYLPSDYSDSVSKRIKPAEPLTPDFIFEETFCNFLGRIYFIGIWVFHKLLVKSLFRKAIKSK